MAGPTKIEWCTDVWNPIRGCTRVSPGCVNCYAERVAARFAGDGQPYAGLAEHVTRPDGTREARWTGRMSYGHNIDAPIRWQRPRRIFVNSMSDLFHEAVPDAEIDRIFAVMALAPQHTFQVLTKRSARMRAYCSNPMTRERIDQVMDAIAPAHWHRRELEDFGGWPLPNVWLGVSTEDQPRANERVPDLLATPAAVRFVSYEPALGPVDFSAIADPSDPNYYIDALRGYFMGRHEKAADYLPHEGLDWIIAGGESGPHARPAHPDWCRSVRDQCAAAGVPFFFKQWGEWRPSDPQAAGSNPRSGWMSILGQVGRIDKREELYPSAGAAFVEHVGKRAAGRMLDGREHNDLPRRSAP